MTAGYYRFPTIYHDTIVFVSEDDLWTVSRHGGIARRLTSNLGEVNHPALSPDGQWLAFVGREEGMPEVYLMPADGGSARRMTYFNSRCQVLGWSRDGRAILFASNAGQFYPGDYSLFQIAHESRNGGAVPMPVGPARSIAFGPDGAVVIGRNPGDPARWKRYRGGTAGHLWIDSDGNGQFERYLAGIRGNIASPMWLETGEGPRVFFVSDHEGVGNLYSATPAGDDLRRHTDHEDFYARNPSTDGRRIVYHAGADLYVYDPETQRSDLVVAECRSPRVQRNRRFVPAAAYLDHARLHPSGDALAVTTRGKAFAFFNHEGPVLRLGAPNGARHRLPDWLNDGQRLVMVDDEAGEEELVIYSADLEEEPRRLSGLDIGRPIAIRVSPLGEKVAISNHRQELLIVDLESSQVTVVDRSEWRPIAGFDWAPDGRWLAYGFAASLTTTEIRLYRLVEPEETNPENVATDGEGDPSPAVAPAPNPIAVTRPVLHDVGPSFDPDGKYLYFLSYREFNPVYDNLQFDLGFPWGMRPYLITLQADRANPFIPRPDGGDEDEGAGEEQESDEPEEDAETDDEADLEPADDELDDELLDEEEDDDGEDELEHNGADDADSDANQRRRRPAQRPRNRESTMRTTAKAVVTETPEGSQEPGDEHRKGKSHKSSNRERELVIDLEGIERRVIAFPVPDNRYGQIAGVPGRALFTSFPARGALDLENGWDDDDDTDYGALRAWVFKDYKSEPIADHVSTFEVSRNRKKVLYFSGRRVRVISATEKAPHDSGPGRKSGWIDLSRIKVSVSPPSEWEQMYREAWRLQRDHFWTEDMADVDWNAVYDRYLPLLDRVNSRSEFSDLVWEMQGELGTSHALEFGGDYRPSPYYSQGVLGANLAWDADAGGYRIHDIVAGDSWEPDECSPLAAPGVDIREGDVLLAINGQRLDAETSPAQLLVNQAGQEVLLTLPVRRVNGTPGEPSPAQAEPTAQPTSPGERERKARAVVVRQLRQRSCPLPCLG
ncbi:MAG: PDZ domain-containing protein [Anaerolineales bacterium]|nr:PDZ domain-containing protein [Anaerolineales bacterium]